MAVVAVEATEEPVEGAAEEVGVAGLDALFDFVVEGVFVDRLVAADLCVEGLEDEVVVGRQGGGVAVGDAVEEVVVPELFEGFAEGEGREVGAEVAELGGGFGADFGDASAHVGVGEVGADVEEA